MAMSDGDVATDDLARPSLGDRLKREREAKGLSLAEAAERLHLRREQVNALETSQFDYIKGDVFVRGYLKAYARLLDLDADEVVSQYDRLVPSRYWRPLDNVRDDPQLTAIPSWLPAVAVGAVVVVVAAVLAIWLFGGGQTKPGTAAPVPAGSTERAATGAVNDTAPPATGAPAAAAPPAPAEPAREPAMAAPEAASPTPTSAAPASGAGAAPTVSPARLTMRFTANCWVEVRDSSRKLLAADLKHAGDTLVLDGEPPYRVVLGYVPGVSVTLGGKPVSIESEPGKQSAKLTIGKQP